MPRRYRELLIIDIEIRREIQIIDLSGNISPRVFSDRLQSKKGGLYRVLFHGFYTAYAFCLCTSHGAGCIVQVINI